MRILAVTTLYPRPGHETVAAFNLQQFRALATRHDLAVIAPVLWTEEARGRWAGRPTPASRRDGDVAVRHPVYYYPPKVLAHRYGECYRASIRREFARAVAEFRPDVVLGCYAHPDGWAAVHLAHQAGLPAVIKIVGTDVLVSGRHGRRRRKVAEALREADGVVAVSRDLARHAAELGAEPRRIWVVPEGVDTGLFSPGDRGEARARLGLAAATPTVLFVGNVLMSKGAGVLVEACGLLARRGLDFACHLVGRGRDEPRVRALVARRALDGRVTLAGPRPLAELPDWYRACDVVALPSFSEGIPNVLREARACGRPFVATRVGGIPEIAEPGSSLLVPPGSATELADALALALGGGLAGGDGCGTPPLSWGESADALADAIREAARLRLDFASKHESYGTNGTEPPLSRDFDIRGASPAITPIQAEPRRMRILAVTTLYPRPGHETVAAFNLQQFRALATRHDLAVIAPVLWTEEARGRWAGRPTPASRRDGDVAVRHPVYYYPPKLLAHRYGECYRASIRREFARAVAEFRPDVVLGCYAHPDGWAAVHLAHQAGLPAVIKSHGSSVLVGARRWPRRAKVAEGLKEADGVVAVSRDLADHIIRLGTDPWKVRVVYNGVDTGLFSPGDRGEARARLGLAAATPTVLFVGNVLMSKGAGVLVEACGLLARRGLDFACHLVGRGRDEPRVRALVARRALDGRVTLAGPRPLAELPDWYRACDVVALPSFSEGIPNVLREARACGRPFVATRVGGIPEIAEPGSSLLVPPGSATELADALALALGGGLAGGDGCGTPPLSWGESADALADAIREAIWRFRGARSPGRADDVTPAMGAPGSRELPA